MSYRFAKYPVVGMLVAYVAGCGILGHSLGDFAAPIFGTASKSGWGIFAAAEEFLLLVTVPLLMCAVIWQRVRPFAFLLWLFAMAGLLGQQLLLSRCLLYCDVP